MLSAALVRSVSIPGTQMDVKLATQVGQPYDEGAVARDVRTLWNLGRFSDVRAEAEEDEDGVDVVFHVVPEPRYDLREVRFEPHPFGLQVTIEPGTLMTRTEAAHTANLARDQLMRRGYADARVTWRFVPAPHGRYDLMLAIDPGRQGGKRKQAPLPAAPRALCECLFEERREAEWKGILDFNASLDEAGSLHIERGRPYILRRLTFHGNHHYSDALVRGHFLVDEAAPLDLFLLRQSVVRLNQAGLFEPVDEHQVHIATDQRIGMADVTVNLTERKRRAWSLSGPIPVSASLSARVLSTYSLSFHLLAFSAVLELVANKRVLPVFSAEQAFTPGQGWRSGLAFAPQLGWRGTAFGYASTQFQKRMLPLLAGTRAPDLAVAKGDSALLCKYPKPRKAAARIGASLVLRYAGQFAGLP